MLLARAFDTKFSSLYKAGKITGGVYLGRGHEAIAACGGVFLTAGYDVIAPFIREQAARVTWGEPIIEAARAYLGSALGYMKGRDGNVHRGLPAEGYMAPISHLGSTVAFVIGCLFAKRLDGKLPGPVGVAFCGDGTTSTGAFHEAANMANVERLPLVLVVTNNQFAYSTPNIRDSEKPPWRTGAAATDSPCMKRTARTSWPRWKPSGPPSITRGRAGAPSGCLPRLSACAGTGNMTTPPTSPGS